MTFLGDYSTSKGRWLGGSGLAVLLATGFIGSRTFSPSSIQEEKPPAIIRENERVNALVELSEIYNGGFGLEGGDLIEHNSYETVDSFVSSWERLPKVERYDVLSSLVKLQLRDTGYGVRDFTRDNIGDAMFFMLGGGL